MCSTLRLRPSIAFTMCERNQFNAHRFLGGYPRPTHWQTNGALRRKLVPGWTRTSATPLNKLAAGPARVAASGSFAGLGTTSRAAVSSRSSAWSVPR